VLSPEGKETKTASAQKTHRCLLAVIIVFVVIVLVLVLFVATNMSSSTFRAKLPRVLVKIVVCVVCSWLGLRGVRGVAQARAREDENSQTDELNPSTPLSEVVDAAGTRR
jgi:flagellar basal body-associated protein FliL